MKKTLRDKIDTWMLPLSIFIGAVGCKIFHHLHFLLPVTVFAILFFTFLKVDPLTLRLKKWHAIVLALQIIFAVGSYLFINNFLTLFFDNQQDMHLIALSMMICFIIPTATTAPVIVAKLGVPINAITTYTLLINFATAFTVPLLFTLFNPTAEHSFTESIVLIMQHTAPVLVGPFLTAWAIRLIFNALRKKSQYDELLLKTKDISFYLWGFNLIILIADVVFLLLHETYNPWTVVFICICATIAALTQFRLGKKIGKRFTDNSQNHNYIAVTQAFGQKNTTFGVWISYTFLNPITSIGAALYIFLQNMYNTFLIKKHIQEENMQQ